MEESNASPSVTCSGGIMTEEQAPQESVTIIQMSTASKAEATESSLNCPGIVSRFSPAHSEKMIEAEKQEGTLTEEDDMQIIDVDTVDMVESCDDIVPSEESPSTTQSRTHPCENEPTPVFTHKDKSTDNRHLVVAVIPEQKSPEQERTNPSLNTSSPPDVIPIPARVQVNQNPTPAVRLTNFSIAEILKPEFGPNSRDNKPWRPLDYNDDSPFSSRADKCLEGQKKSASSRAHSFLKQEKCDFREEEALTGRRSSGGPSPGSPLPPAGEILPQPMIWPAWVYCTRYSDRPSSGPRTRKMKKKEKTPEEKRPRTAFTNEQLRKLRVEFEENRYLTEERRQRLARDLDLNESQIKIWFQNKRAKMKKASGVKNALALQLMAQGLYQHSTCLTTDDN